MAPFTPPPFSQQQIEYLRRLYPDRCPDPDMSDREIWIAVGASKVVTKLETLEKNRTIQTVLP